MWYMCLNNTWLILIQRYNQKLPFSSQERSNWLFLQQCSRTIFWLSREREHVYDSTHSLQETLFNIMWCCLFHALSYSNFIFNFPSNCTFTIEYLYWILNVCYMFRRSLRHPQGELLSLSKTIFYCQVVTMFELGLSNWPQQLEQKRNLSCHNNMNYIRSSSSVPTSVNLLQTRFLIF